MVDFRDPVQTILMDEPMIGDDLDGKAGDGFDFVKAETLERSLPDQFRRAAELTQRGQRADAADRVASKKGPTAKKPVNTLDSLNLDSLNKGP